MYFAPRITVPWKASYLGNKKVQRDSVERCSPGTVTFQDHTTPEAHSFATLAQVPTCTFTLFRSSWERQNSLQPLQTQRQSMVQTLPMALWSHSALYLQNFSYSFHGIQKECELGKTQRPRGKHSPVNANALFGMFTRHTAFRKPVKLCLLHHFLDLFGHGNFFSLKSINISWIL